MAGWIRANTGWDNYAQMMKRMSSEEVVREAAHRAATDTVIEGMAEEIWSDPALNGDIRKRIQTDPNADPATKARLMAAVGDYTPIIEHLQTFEDKDNVYVGIPTSNPASDLAFEMEMGGPNGEPPPPTPVLRYNYEAARDDGSAAGAFSHYLQKLAKS